MKFGFVKAVLISILLAPNYAGASGWYSNFSISELQYSRGADGLHLKYFGGEGDPNPDSCTSAGVFYVPYISSVPEREKAMISGASMAFASDRNISVFVDGCASGIGGKTYPRVHYLYVYK